MNCEYKCLNGWIADRGVNDSVIEEDGTLLLLYWPTEFHPCPRCNAYSWTNSDLVDHEDFEDVRSLTISMLNGGQ